MKLWPWNRSKPVPHLRKPSAEPLDACQILFGAQTTGNIEPGAEPDRRIAIFPPPQTAVPADAAPAGALPVVAEGLTAEVGAAEEVGAPDRAMPSPHPRDSQYRTPPDLLVSELPMQRALVIGSCFSTSMPVYLGFAFPMMQADHILYNHVGNLPDAPPQPLEIYAFQVIMLSLRTAMPEQLYFRLNYNDIEGHQAAFATARERLTQMLHGALGYRDKRQITTFVSNFAVPQQNLLGRLLPRYDLRNPIYFIEMLNKAIAEEIADLPDVHLLDIDQISANFGRKYIQDDVLCLINHHSMISDYDHVFDQGRIEVPPPFTSFQPDRNEEYLVAISFELKAMYRTLRQADQVKLVIVDLDDTLWRGVVAEEGLDRPMVTEGWPSGFAEALIFLKKRGVLLAIVSKNDEERIRELWPRIYGSRLELDDFASVKINWEPKADNVELILTETNLLPRSAVFIDDNPVERANVAAAYPDMRILGASPYLLRRTLLWAAETQVAYITDESARRTEMIQAQVARETTRSRLTRAEFLETLDVNIQLYAITDVTDTRFARAFELVNKSNQFNTTGRRWTQDECQRGFATDLTFWAFEVDDRFTRYGTVGVAIVRRGCIDQFVMSCRVVGLDVEIAVIAVLVEDMPGEITASFVTTDANFLCRDLFARCGFVQTNTGWQKPPDLLVPRPAHIRSLQRHSRLEAIVG